jgi:hypothetical protein
VAYGILRRILKFLAVVVAGIVLSIVGLVVYGLFADPSAEAKAREFCAAVEIGSPFAPVAELASGTGEPLLMLLREDSVTLGFTGMPPFSRHLCRVEHEGGRITSAEYLHLD